jgi:polyvinyl alcohol dehydrogenase (cytochrome)
VFSRAPGSRSDARRVGVRARTTVLALVAASALAVAAPAFAGGSDWATGGHDPAGTRNQPFEHQISPANVAQLAPKWVATTTGDVSGTPAVVDGAVYFGDFGGTLWKLDAATGAVIWSHKVSDYTGIAGDYARTSPSVDGTTLIVGDIKAPDLLGIDTTTGALRWITPVHPDPKGIMTGSPVLVGNTIITGVSAANASGVGATFRGAIVAVNALTGQIIWRTYSLPDNGGVAGGYSGATMFSSPVVDASLGLVYGTFGQTYTEPASVAACNLAAANGFDESCEQPGAYFKSIVAFDLQTGAVRWSYRVLGHAPWERACGSPPLGVTWCPVESDSEKWDLGGSSPNVFQLGTGWGARDVVGLGEKGGIYLLLDARTGAFIWNTVVGTGGDQGGFEWGTAYDGSRIYGSITNQHHLPYNLTENGVVTDQTVTGGSWSALDPATGKILWQTADPQSETLPAPVGTVGVWDLAPVTSANGVLYGASMAQTGSQMYALDAATGKILWQYAAGSSVNAAPAVVDGTVYWGSGYAKSAEGSGNDKLFAFSINGTQTSPPVPGGPHPPIGHPRRPPHRWHPPIYRRIFEAFGR